MNSVVVGVGDCKFSKDPNDVLVTYALGSCIAVGIYDPDTKVGGLLHFMLPESAVDPNNGSNSPFRYADTGTPMLFREAYKMGAEKRRLLVRLAGGAAVFDDGGVFSIGKRNCAAIRKILWKAGVRIHAEDLGGTCSRTVRMDLATGRFTIQNAGAKEQELTSKGSSLQGGQLCLAGC